MQYLMRQTDYTGQTSEEMARAELESFASRNLNTSYTLYQLVPVVTAITTTATKLTEHLTKQAEPPAPTLKVGDRVKIWRFPTEWIGRSSESDMRKWVGKVGKITTTWMDGTYGVDGEYCWPRSCLALVPPQPSKPKRAKK